MIGKDLWRMLWSPRSKNLRNTEMEDSDNENCIILRTEKIQEKEAEPQKERARRMTSRSRAFLDNLEEISSDSEDEEGNYLVVSKEMVESTSFGCQNCVSKGRYG
jgi:hypothetical protein